MRARAGLTGPAADEEVVLVLSDRQVLGRVLDTGDGYARIAVAAHARGHKLRRENDATLLFAAERGVKRLKGVIRRDGFRSPAVRFEFEASKRHIQRRRHVRVDAEVPVTLRLSTAGSDSLLRSKTVNLSGGGLEIVDNVGLPLNAIVKIELRLPGQLTPVPLTGRIVRRARPNTKGVKIERMILSDQDRLVKFIFTRQRLELRQRQIA